MDPIYAYFVSFMLSLQLSDSSINLARGKNTQQWQTVNSSYTSDKAVDGYLTSCSYSPGGYREAWWRVDFPTMSTIRSVNIYYRKSYNYRFAGFSVFVSNISNFLGALCFHDQGPDLPHTSQSISCPFNTQYVFLFNNRLPHVTYPDRYSTWAFLELCEVEVYGCQRGRYGDNCRNYCSNGCISNTCDPDTGFCSCINGFIGDLCDNCTVGRIGQYCNESCSNGCVDGVCRRDGTCIRGCRYGFTGQRCDTCIIGLYGYQCNMTCSVGCKEDTCFRYNETCSAGCQFGFTGLKCDECITGKYGYHCNKTCSVGCTGEICSRFNGTCSNGCEPSFVGSSCDDCVSGFYGTECNTTCPEGCFQRICDRESGICITNCSIGYSGLRCNECIDGRYGEKCDIDCSSNCFNKTCNRPSGDCSLGCNDDWGGTKCNVSLAPIRNSPADTANTQPAMIAGVVVGILFIIAVAVFVLIFVIRRRSTKAVNKSESKSNMLDSIPDTTTESIEADGSGMIEVEKHSNGKRIINSTTVRYNRSDIYENTADLYYNVNEPGIPVKELKDYINQRTKSDFEKEYKKLPEGSKFPHEYSNKPENKVKNRFQRAYCYDHSRVVLDSANNTNSDYINANYIDRVEQRQFYIATQGPRFNTVVDFWRMVWQVKSTVIVMLTNLVEIGKVKCEQYWPDIGKEIKSGDLSLTTEAVHTYASFSLRKIRIESTEEESHIVSQYHFTSWPDHGTPDPMELVLFHNKIVPRKNESKGPLIVHCSAGIGRTGTFIALDALLEYGKRTGRIDIFDFVKTMRKDRMNMIQTLEQYIFLHEVLADVFNFKDTSITKEQIIKLFQEQSTDTDNDPVYNNSKIASRIEDEFKMLQCQKQVYDKKDYKAGLLEQNRNKNRENCPLALDQYRAFVIPRAPQRSNYINAIYLPSYTTRRGYIISHIPVENTVLDLWSVIIDQGSKTLVLLAVDDLEQFATWLPTNGVDISIGTFTIKKKPIEEEYTPKIKKMTLTVDEKDKVSGITIKTYIHHSLMNEDATFDKQDILNLIDMIFLEDSEPFTVICPDGATSCGLFCAIRDLIGSLETEGEVDVYQTVRQIQLRRPECISTLVQYRHCYEIMNEYLTNENVYANN